MKLPHDIEDIVLDYFWSHWVFNKKQEIHMHLRHVWMLREVRLFYDVFYSPINPYPLPYAHHPPWFVDIPAHL